MTTQYPDDLLKLGWPEKVRATKQLHDHNWQGPSWTELTAMELNVCVLMSHWKPALLDEYIQHFDIVCCSEIESINLGADDMHGYKYFI